MKRKAKATFRNTLPGQIVFAHTAHYVAGRMRKSAVNLPKFESSGFDLSVIGINKATALAELYPKIPRAHFWYANHGDSKRVYKTCLTWESFWAAVLYNRVIYFFRKHHPDGGLIRCIAEWPGTVSEDGQWLVPPPIPVVEGGFWPEGSEPPEPWELPPDERPPDPSEVHSLRRQYDCDAT
jgi:hypothetical protein